MPIGGFEGPSGRRVRSVERALSASTLLPTLAFAALGAVTVLLVAQMGISPLGAVVGPSARDGGHAVTTPRMSISLGPPRLHRSAPARDRETTTGDALTTLTLARPEAPPIPPTRGRETTTADAHSAAVSAVVIGAAITDAEASSVAVTSSAATTKEVTTKEVTTKEVTTEEVTTEAVEPQVQADTEVMAASEVMYTLLTRTAMAPALEPEDQKSQKSQNEDTSVPSVKPPQTTQSTDATDATEHAKAAKNGS